MKTISILAVLLLGLLAGCASHHRTAGPSSKPVAPSKLEANDDSRIQAAVYSYLLDKHPWDNGDYAAIFLQGDDARVAAMIKKFPKHVPPLKPASQAELRPNQTPLDRASGKPALLLTARALGPTNGVSEAVGTWYAGADVTGLYAFVLVEVDGQWTVQSAK